MKSRSDKGKPRAPNTQVKRRIRRYNSTSILITGIAVLLFALFITIRLFQIQVLDHNEYRALAAQQHYSRETTYPKRGSIFDAAGTRLAGTKMVYRVGMTPKDAKSYLRLVDLDEIAGKAAAELGLDARELRAQMDLHDETYVLLAKDIAEEQATALRLWLSDNGVGGFRFDAEARRVYSNNDLAGQVIGYTRFDEQQLSGALGLELQYNGMLSGNPGYTYAKRDNFLSRGVVPYASSTSRDPQNGADLHLTLNADVQRVLQETLIETAASMGLTQKVTGIVMDPWNGAILGMGQIPTMRSDDPFGAPDFLGEDAWARMGAAQTEYLMANVWRNQNVSDVYEPGSTMKAITAGIAFEMSITNENVLYNDDPIDIRDYSIRCHVPGGHGVETLAQGFINSCNPVFVHVGHQIGMERYYEYFRQFGFYERTGIDLPGEASSLIHTHPTDLDFANLTFGESTAVTPIQMISSYAAIANGGRQIIPHVVDYAVQDSTRIYEGNAGTGAPLMSQQTAARVRSLMADVGRLSYNYTHGAEGYRVGGKTSTSTDEVDGGFTYSYIGIAPIEAPRIVAMIIIHKPQVDAPSSVVATRPTNRLISRVLDILGEERTLSNTDYLRLNKTVVMPNVIGMPLKDAAFALSELDIWSFPGRPDMLPDDRIADQMPAPGSPISAGARIYLYPAPVNDVEWVTVPDFTGKSFFEAQSLAADAGVVLRAVGVNADGVQSQSPAPTHAGVVRTADQSGAPVQIDPERTVRRGSVVTVYFTSAGDQTNEALPNEAGD